MVRWIVLVTMLVAACGGRRQIAAAPEPAEEIVDLPWSRLCPSTWRAAAQSMRVRAIRVENQHADSVAVWVDICMGSVRVGDVAGATTRLFRIPADALLFGDSLRLDVFPLARTGMLRELRVRPDTSGMLRLVVLPWVSESESPTGR